MRSIVGPLTKMIIFTVVTVIATALLAATIANISFRSTAGYRARFTDVAGLIVGDDVRIAALPPPAEAYAVGGRVRDEFRMRLDGIGRPPKDLDYVVTGIPSDALLAALQAIGRVDVVGASFAVLKFRHEAGEADIALPRREWSTGTHHRDFRIESAPDIPIEEDLARRDFRINMMARDVRIGRLVDPHGGRADLQAKRLDILIPETFVEDPLRILRGAQLAARFDLVPTPATINAMKAASHLLSTVAPERVADELTKLLVRARNPSVGFELIRHVGGLELVLPELAEGWNVDQNQYHAHTVYYHSLYTCDAAPSELVRGFTTSWKSAASRSVTSPGGAASTVARLWRYTS